VAHFILAYAAQLTKHVAIKDMTTAAEDSEFRPSAAFLSRCKSHLSVC